MAKDALELATLGGGCFWCLEAVFEQVRGVESVVSGYSGGQGENPTYRDVCSGNSGHAEVVRIAFDPAELTYPELLEVFFTIHDPTTLNRQGNDVGTQYRSVIYFHSEAQKSAAHSMIQSIEVSLGGESRVVTEVAAAPAFFAAEDYHQQYFRRSPDQAYCQLVVAPKLAKFRSLFRSRMRATLRSGPI